MLGRRWNEDGSWARACGSWRRSVVTLWYSFVVRGSPGLREYRGLDSNDVRMFLGSSQFQASNWDEEQQ